MAVLAPQDWYLPSRDHTMDLSSSSPSSLNPPSATRQSSAPSQPTDTPLQSTPQQQQLHQQQQQQQQSQPYSFPLQQQPQGSWTPSITAQPFYPSFYQNPRQQ